MDIEIYSAEQEIAHLVKNSNVISHLVELQEVAPFNISEKMQASINSIERPNVDLHFLQSLLVSSVWNGNDEYFSPVELWNARNTAKDKPFNLEHECDDIIGHMTNSYVIDGDGNTVPDNTSLDNLPDLIHIISQAVLYKHWNKEDKQTRMDSILADLKENKWFVSIECLFPTFDYMLRSTNGEMKLIARNKNTAHLTKYLRVYNGVGVYDGQQIGRVPRNLILSGKGLVKKPANPFSVIFAKQYEVSKNKLEMVYQIQEVIKMDNDKEVQYKSTIEKLQADYNQLKASLSDNKFKELEAKLEVANKTVEAHGQEVIALKASVETVNKDKIELAKLVDNLQAQKKEAEDKINKITADQKYAERINVCKAKLAMDDDQAKTFSTSLNLLDDKNFIEFVDFQAKFTQLKASVTVSTEKVAADTKVLETVDKKVTEPNLSVTHVAPTQQEKLIALKASLADFMDKSNYRKTVEPKFKS